MSTPVVNAAEADAIRFLAEEVNYDGDPFNPTGPWSMAEFRDDAQLGWLYVVYQHELVTGFWIVSPRGRVWVSDNNMNRHDLIREVVT